MRIAITSTILVLTFFSAVADPVSNSKKVDGYKGIWFTLGQFLEHGDKYSGGLGTYTAKHVPLAIYAPEVNKTFFVYGGTRSADERYLLCMASFYDHTTGRVPKPTLVHDKEGVNDPHDNPSISIDRQGHVWIFVSGRGRTRPGFLYRSSTPYSMDAFECIRECEMTYPQPWFVQDQGFLLCLTKYTKGRELYWSTSVDGHTWAEDRKLAGMGGHYQTSRENQGRIITAFNYHPNGNVDKRTNLYYAETGNFGKTWQNASGETIVTPLTDTKNPSLIHDYEAENRLVYMKDINFDRQGRPVILVITSGGYAPGPENNPRTWTIVHWNGTAWDFREVTQSTHNYDMGSMYIEEDGIWRIIAPTESGPQPFGTGGEMAVWLSRDEGVTWKKERDITRNSKHNHAYARRPVNAHPDFYAFWADGNPDAFSQSQLYFSNKDGDKVWMLPYDMTEDWATPMRITE
ncbi:MAG: BNR-4 repeat-containing protein [Candidatus Hydrogenedentes bacterium]|nr:BNR-4 repeat-containing protein [Candidatus Hydrogenedentota bacterium]